MNPKNQPFHWVVHHHLTHLNYKFDSNPKHTKSVIPTKRVSTHYFILLKEILKGLPQTGMRVVKKRIHEVEHSERMEIWFSIEIVKLSICRLPWISVTPFFSSLSDRALTGFLLLSTMSLHWIVTDSFLSF